MDVYLEGLRNQDPDDLRKAEFNRGDDEVHPPVSVEVDGIGEDLGAFRLQDLVRIRGKQVSAFGIPAIINLDLGLGAEGRSFGVEIRRASRSIRPSPFKSVIFVMLVCSSLSSGASRMVCVPVAIRSNRRSITWSGGPSKPPPGF